MEKHFCFAGADIIWHAMKAFFFHSPPPVVIKLYVTLICENVFLFFNTILLGKVQCNEIDAFYYYWLPFGLVMPYAVSPLLFTSKFMVGKINF